MRLRFDKKSVTTEQLKKYAKDLNGRIEEDDTFYSIVFPFNDEDNEK